MHWRKKDEQVQEKSHVGGKKMNQCKGRFFWSKMKMNKTTNEMSQSFPLQYCPINTVILQNPKKKTP